MVSILIYLFLLFTSCLYSFLDKNDKFIEDIKEIKLPDNSHQNFNPSIVPYKNHYLLSYRHKKTKKSYSHEVYLVELDNNFNPISQPQLLDIPIPKIAAITVQDPRLFEFNNDLYMTFNNYYDKKMYISQIVEKNDEFVVHNLNIITKHPLAHGQIMEKNWSPFVYSDSIFFIRSFDPYFVYKYDKNTNSCTNITFNYSEIEWEYGQIRGGTPCLKINNNFLTFFHSSKKFFSSFHNKSLKHYIIGAALISSEPPFEVKAISKKPIFHEEFYNGDISIPWKPMLVVFPCGFIVEENKIHLVFGKQDASCFVATIDIKGLFKSLKKVKVIQQTNI
jgi:predicted GH43/DUF377 family glycosyl hydrolase